MERAPVARNHPDILLVTIDTLRADRVGRGLMPTLDGLARRGLQFTNARSAVPLTLPSHTTIMTGVAPTVHGVRENGQRFDRRVPTLPRRLREAGYRTAAFIGAYVLDGHFGLNDGFEVYDDRVHRDADAPARFEAERRGGEVVDAALSWLKDARSPFFIWVHLYDPHAPYEPPPEFLAKAGGNPYDGEVAYADAQLARLLDSVSGRGLPPSTLIVVAGDHGEGLGEHGEQTHGMLAYDSTLRVPLVLAGGGVSAHTITSPVSLTDLAPSLLARAGIGQPKASAKAANLFDEPPPDRDIYAETQYPRAVGWHPLATLAGERWKIVLSSAAELYDLKSDPGEAHDIAAAHQPIVQGMTSRLAELQRTTGSASAEVPADAAERLKALGYVSGSRLPIDARAPNPASVIDDWTTFERAQTLATSGRGGEALPLLKHLASRFESAAVFQTAYARALLDSGDARAALGVLRATVAHVRADSVLYHELALAARTAGEPAEALRAEQAALALDPSNPAALNGLGLLQADAGKPEEAATSFQHAAEGDPANASYWSNLGNARRAVGDLVGAESAYRRALAADLSYPDAANGLGVLLVQEKKPAEAIPWFERALRRAPDHVEARLNLGIAYQESGDRERARDMYREVLAKAPPRYARERKAARTLLASLR
jgi:choline-sulfatase